MVSRHRTKLQDDQTAREGVRENQAGLRRNLHTANRPRLRRSAPSRLACAFRDRVFGARHRGSGCGRGSRRRFLDLIIRLRRPIARGRQRAVRCDWSDGCAAAGRSRRQRAADARTADQTPRHRSDTAAYRTHATHNFEIDNFLGSS